MASADPVVIVGAGPAGLLLGRYLQIHHVPCVIYEREESASARQQGGSLDLHDDTGLLALRETGLLDEASTMMRAEGEALKIVDKAGKIWWDENDTKALDAAADEGKEQVMGVQTATGRPEIDRTDLRNLMLRSLEPTSIKWGHGVKSCRALSTSSYELTLYNGEIITTPVLVGADGTFSKVRSLVHNVKPEYSGLTMYDMMIPKAGMTPPLKRYVGMGGSMVLDDGKGLMLQMNSGGKCKVYPAVKEPENWLEENPLPETGKREWIARLFDDWDPMNREAIMAADEDGIVPRKIWKFPSDLRWETPNTGVTVIGDAAHVMSPFAGEGVNQALADGLALGKALVRAYTVPRPASSLPPFPLSLLPISHSPPETPTIRTPAPKKLGRELRRFEKRMMARAKPYMVESQANLELCFGDGGGAKTFKNAFIWMIAREVSKMVIFAPWMLVSKLWEEED